jgi:hypothetical protein
MEQPLVVLPHHKVKYVPPAYSAVASEGVEVEGEEVEESEGAQKCYLAPVDHKLSTQKYYFFKIGFWGCQTLERCERCN